MTEKQTEVRTRGDEEEQGRKHGRPCRGRLGRGSNDLGRDINIHEVLLSEVFYLQIPLKRKKSRWDGRTDERTDGRTDRPTDRNSDLKFALPATKRRRRWESKKNKSEMVREY